MGRPRKPTAILEASGAFAKNPARGRARANEPKPTAPIGDPPALLAKTAVECWHNLVARVPYPLTNADEHIVALTCHLEARIRNGKAQGWEVGQYTKCLAKLGMSPSDRSNVQMPASDEKDPFAAI